MTTAFDEAAILVKRDPLPFDIIERLGRLERKVDLDEVEDFQWFYESANLIIDDRAPDRA